MRMLLDLDMNNKKIRNLDDPTRGRRGQSRLPPRLTTVHKALILNRFRDYFFFDYSNRYASALYQI